MKPTISLRRAFADKQLLGGVLHGKSWHAWRVLMIAAMGERLTDIERATFTALTGRATEPLQRVEELCCVVGRRAEKVEQWQLLLVSSQVCATTVSCVANVASYC